MIINNVADLDLEVILHDIEVTLITKKARKEIKVWASWYDDETNILCASYTDRFGKYAVKQFNMKNYDFYI